MSAPVQVITDRATLDAWWDANRWDGLLEAWIDDPVLFVWDHFRVAPDLWQAEVCWAVAVEKRIALLACKGPGKTALLAWLVLWWLATRPDCKVAATSITDDNLRDNLWAELAKWQRASPYLSTQFRWRAERVAHVTYHETWWCSARTWSRSADAETQGQTLAGLHADHIMLVVDEAGGVPDAVVEVADAVLANIDPLQGRDARLIIAGNPVLLEGPLYRAAVRERSAWWIREITGDPDRADRAPRVSLEWAREKIARLGRDHPWVRVNVLGMFPERGILSLMGPDEVTAAMRRTIPEVEYIWSERVIGVDVGWYGDDPSVIWPRQGRVAFRPIVLHGAEKLRLLDHILRAIQAFKPDAVFIDAAGAGGPIIEDLRKLDLNVLVRGVDFGGAALAKERFYNHRAEIWAQLADWINKAQPAIADVPEAVEELCAPLYSYNNAGCRLQVESKDQVKKRIGRSTDHADALACTFHAPVEAANRRRELGFDPSWPKDAVARTTAYRSPEQRARL